MSGSKEKIHSASANKVAPRTIPLERQNSLLDLTKKLTIACFGSEGSTKRKLCHLLNLTALSLIPGVMLIVGNTSNLIENVKTLEANSFIKDNIQSSVEISGVIHNMQIERGTTALYVSSNGDPFVRPRLQILYPKTDAAILSLSKWIPIGNSIYESRDSFQAEIERFRLDMDPTNVTLSDVIHYYTDHVSEFIKMIGKSISIERSLSYWTDLVAYQMLIISKEQAGIERALGSTYFARGLFPLTDLIWYREKRILGASFLDQSVRFSAFVQSLINDKFSNSSLERELMQMRETIMDNVASTPSVVSGAIWFDNMTTYINVLKVVQDELAQKIVQLGLTDGQLYQTAIHRDPDIAGRLTSAPRARFLQKLLATFRLQSSDIFEPWMSVLSLDYTPYGDVLLILSETTIDENTGLQQIVLSSSLELTAAILLAPMIIVLMGHVILKSHALSATLRKTTSELTQSRKNTEQMLHEALPKSVSQKYLKDGSVSPEAYHSVTILFTGVVNFNSLLSRCTTMEVIGVLHQVQATIEGRLKYFDVCKIECVGDRYMIASGMPRRNGSAHVEEIAKLSLDLLKATGLMEVPNLENGKVQLRLGFHTGPCLTGLSGYKMPRYCVFSETVSLASMMESTGLPLKIQLSMESAYKLRKKEGYSIEERGAFELKGREAMTTYWLEGYHRSTDLSDVSPAGEARMISVKEL